MEPVTYPVIGFRAWRTDGGASLRSVAQEYHWELGTNIAQCLAPFRRHLGPSPAAKCDCGLYAWHDYDDVVTTYGDRFLVGIVRGWGQLQVHRDGWRAQHAEVLAIVQRGDEEACQGAQKAAERFGVPLLHESALPGAAADFGRVVPVDRRPNTPIMAGKRMVARNGDLETSLVFAAWFTFALAGITIRRVVKAVRRSS